MSEMAAICKIGLQPDFTGRGKFKPLAGAIVCEQAAFIVDEAEAALSRPSPVTCERALRRISEMAREILPLMPKLVAQVEAEDTIADIRDELAVRAKRRKGWCPAKTPIAREFDARARELGSKQQCTRTIRG